MLSFLGHRFFVLVILFRFFFSSYWCKGRSFCAGNVKVLIFEAVHRSAYSVLYDIFVKKNFSAMWLLGAVSKYCLLYITKVQMSYLFFLFLG